MEIKARNKAVWALFILVSGCKASEDDPAKSELAPSAPAMKTGWVGLFARAPDEAQKLAAHEGWRAIYKRDYRAAIAAFDGELQEHERFALARAHLRLGMINLSLSRLLASAYARYFEAREKLSDVAPLRQAAHYKSVSRVLLGRTGDEAWVRSDKGRFYQADCKPQKTRRAQVAVSAKCLGRASLSCAAAPPAKDERIDVYWSAMCGALSEVDETALRELAQTPAEEEEIKANAELSATFEYYDPVALIALGVYHLRKAGLTLDGAKDSALRAALRAQIAFLREGQTSERPAVVDPAQLHGLIFSPWVDTEAVFAGLAPKLEGLMAQVAALKASIQPTRKALLSGKGQQIIDQLALASAPTDGVLRGLGRALLRAERCPEALTILRATAGLKEQIDFRNEPSFLVELASAGLCMRRSAEALGALRAVLAMYPEAEGPMGAAKSLVISRVMGGASSAQETQ